MKNYTLANKTIFIISPEFWDHNFISKHHYAIELARRNNTVYFLNPPSKKSEIKKVKSHLYEVNYKPIVRGINYLPAIIRDRISRMEVLQLMRSNSIEQLDIVWSFDPYRFQNLDIFRAQKKIYHPVDIHNTKLEEVIADTADLILGTSDQILNRFNHLPNPKYKIAHGLADHFVKPYPQSQSKDFIAHQERTKVGLMGNLSYQFLDSKSLIEIIKTFELVDFYFIGPYKESNSSRRQSNRLIDFLQDQPNCFLLGSKPSEELPFYLRQMDLFLMCYSGKSHKAELANPHKLIEYLSVGKVVVSHYVDEYKDKRCLLEMVDENRDLKKRFEEVVANLAIHNSREKCTARKEFARKNTYKAQIQRISEILKAGIQ